MAHETPRDRQAARHPLCLRGLSLDDYTRCIAEAEDDTERQRMIIRDLPRKLHAMAREQRYRMLHARPAPSGTRWDALIGGMVEHVDGSTDGRTRAGTRRRNGSSPPRGS